jgi:prepilin-type N-terminal cleavage/methylation domain-containing protein
MRLRTKGFTVLEILVAMGILGMAVTIVTLSFSRLNENQALDKSVDLAVSVLNEARSLTLSSVDSSRYGVNLESDQLVLFKGSSFSSSAPDNVTTSLNALVGIRNISLSGGGSSVVFDRLTGATNNSGTFELYLKNASTTYSTVTVNATGVVEEN